MKENLVPVAAKVPPDLAKAVARMADASDRSVSGEIRRAIRAHVAQSDLGASSQERAERGGPGSSPAVEPPQPARKEQP
jgi:hypothetical protein